MTKFTLCLRASKFIVTWRWLCAVFTFSSMSLFINDVIIKIQLWGDVCVCATCYTLKTVVPAHPRIPVLHNSQQFAVIKSENNFNYNFTKVLNVVGGKLCKVVSQLKIKCNKNDYHFSAYISVDNQEEIVVGQQRILSLFEMATWLLDFRFWFSL